MLSPRSSENLGGSGSLSSICTYILSSLLGMRIFFAFVGYWIIMFCIPEFPVSLSELLCLLLSPIRRICLFRFLNYFVSLSF